jgi:hypothetical protein
MAQNYGPKISTLDLILNIDPSNNKSYPAIDLPVKNGLLLWLDAADDTTFNYSSGSIVSQWRDKSGLNNHANQSVVGNQPSRSTFNNSRKSVNFVSSGVDYLLVSANSNLALPGDASIFIVYKPATQTTAYAVLIDNYHGQGGAKGFVIQRVATNSQFYYGNGNGSGFVDTSASPWTYTDNVIQLLSLNKASSTGTPYISGTAQTSRTVHANTVQDTTGLAIGTWGLGGREYNGDMCEILIFNRSLSSTEMKQVHTYLGQKWGISNTDRQIFDLSGNNFNFAFNGTNPRYNAKTIVSNFDTTSPYTVSAFGGQNLTSKVLNLLYSDHTIEVAVNPKGFRSVYSYNNALTTQTVQGVVLWTGQHSGLYFEGTTLYYLYWNTSSTTVNISYNAASYQDKIMYITATRTVDTLRLYINGILVAGPAVVAASTAPLTYTQLNIGLAYFGNPTTQGYVWAGQHEYHLLRMYNRQLTDTEVASNYQAFKARFDNNIVRFGLVMELDAGNPYSYAGAGSDWFDVSGNNNTSLLVGTTLPTFSNTNGGILIYDGDTQYSRTPSPSNNFAWTPSGVGLNNMTIDLWIKTTDGSGTILSKPWSGNGEYNFGLGHQGFSIVIGNQTNTLGFSSILTGNWINLVIVVSPTQYGAYINGVQNTALTNHGITNNTPTYGNGQIELTLMTLYPYGGGGNAGFSTQGNIGSFRIYNRVLSASEVLQNYNATKGRFGL